MLCLVGGYFLNFLYNFQVSIAASISPVPVLSRLFIRLEGAVVCPNVFGLWNKECQRRSILSLSFCMSFSSSALRMRISSIV